MMKPNNKTISILASALLGSAATFAQAAATVPGEILVEVKPHMTEQAIATLLAMHGAREIDSIPQINVRVLRVPAEKRDRVLDALQRNPNIQFAEPNGVATTNAVTNDPYVVNGYEWHVSKIQLAQAWDISTGSASTVIAILDTGVTPGLTDLGANLLAGYNYVGNNTNTDDDHGHGTAVAGSAAALGNNGVGVAGVAWSSSILPVKVADSSGNASYSNIAKGITYAADRGARVINISIAGSSSSSALQSAVDYAWARNAVIVAGAGNNGDTTPQYPAACRNAVGVSATNSSDTKPSWSSYGSYVTLSAPGSGIWTTNRDGTYGSHSGTSFASPVAAGCAALLAAANPALTNAAIVDLLKQNADDLGAAGYDTTYGYGRVNAYRALLAATGGAPVAPVDGTAPTVAITSPASGSTVAGMVTVQVSASDAVGVTKVELYLDGTLGAASASAPASFAWDTTGASNGSHVLRALAYDAAGNVGASAEVTVNVQNVVAAPDTTAPTAVITSPTSGTVVAKALKVYAQASDDVGVGRVELYFDGKFTASSTSSSPVFSLNTSKWTKGSHTLHVIAYDAAGNAGASPAVNVLK